MTRDETFDDANLTACTRGGLFRSLYATAGQITMPEPKMPSAIEATSP